MNILTISGSLRSGSSNAALLDAAALLAPPVVVVDRFDGIGDLPRFNSGLDTPGASAPVERLRDALRAADAVLIRSPEYAHGVPGSLKNALDWVVGSGELVDKPVGLLNASPRATHAQASLVEIIATMSARLVPGAILDAGIPRRDASAAEIAAVPVIAASLAAALRSLDEAAQPTGDLPARSSSSH